MFAAINRQRLFVGLPLQAECELYAATPLQRVSFDIRVEPATQTAFVRAWPFWFPQTFDDHWSTLYLGTPKPPSRKARRNTWVQWASIDWQQYPDGVIDPPLSLPLPANWPAAWISQWGSMHWSSAGQRSSRTGGVLRTPPLGYRWGVRFGCDLFGVFPLYMERTADGMFSAWVPGGGFLSGGTWDLSQPPTNTLQGLINAITASTSAVAMDIVPGASSIPSLSIPVFPRAAVPRYGQLLGVPVPE
jgi:hypothetical protein